MYVVIAEPAVSVYPRRRSAAGTVPLTSFSIPPPTRRLYFTSAMSGSTPVVSQSIMKLIVPVGARTLACAFRYPAVLPRETASSHAWRAAESSVGGTRSAMIRYAAARCFSITRSCALLFFGYASYGPTAAASRADCA